MRKRHILLSLVLISVLSFLFFKGGSALTGNAIVANAAKNVQEKVSCESKLAVSETDLAKSKVELESCQRLKSAAISDMAKFNDTEPAQCDTAVLEEKVSDLTKQRSSCMKSLKEAQDAAKSCVSIDEINQSLNELAKNSAINICCKMRIDNTAINSYRVESNRIVCGENFENSLSCP